MPDCHIQHRKLITPRIHFPRARVDDTQLRTDPAAHGDELTDLGSQAIESRLAVYLDQA